MYAAILLNETITSTMDFKKEAAREATQLIKNDMLIGLGAGSAIGHMVGFIKEKTSAGLSIKIATSSFTTKLLLQQHNFIVQETSSLSVLDLYFDGCDQFDKNLTALKSGGGIHTYEKILAVMAREFILVGDESKYVQELEVKFPLVVEVFPQIHTFFLRAVEDMFTETRIELRMSNKKDGAVISENGNYIFDLWFRQWPELSTLNSLLKNIPGVIETSLFYDIAKRAVIAGKDGAYIISKSAWD